MVSTDIYRSSARMTTAADEAASPRRRRWLPSRRLIARLSQFAVGSVVSTVVSQATLTGLYYWAHTSATEAAAVAFVAGAIPAFLINWHWTWARSGRPAVLSELLPYLMITFGGGLAATGLTTLADKVINPLLTSRGERSLVLDCAYLGSYGLLVLVKFALLDRLMARRRSSVPVEAAA